MNMKVLKSVVISETTSTKVILRPIAALKRNSSLEIRKVERRRKIECAGINTHSPTQYGKPQYIQDLAVPLIFL